MTMNRVQVWVVIAGSRDYPITKVGEYDTLAVFDYADEKRARAFQGCMVLANTQLVPATLTIHGKPAKGGKE